MSLSDFSLRAFLPFRIEPRIDAEPRINDCLLAYFLDYPRAQLCLTTDARRHELEDHYGPLCLHFGVYYYTEDQAAALCMMALCDKAADIRLAMTQALRGLS